MKQLHIRAHDEIIMLRMIELHREIPDVLSVARGCVGTLKKKREINAYQSAVLYHIVKQIHAPNPRILEIGTALGWSAAIMAQAAPHARIETVNIREDESSMARNNLSTFKNVTVINADSHAMVSNYKGPKYDMIFVDGDHDGVAGDMPWFNHLKVGGLMLHHDYAPPGSGRPCRPVYDELNHWRESMGRDFDVLVQDLENVGMAGYVRREGETWQITQR